MCALPAERHTHTQLRSKCHVYSLPPLRPSGFTLHLTEALAAQTTVGRKPAPNKSKRRVMILYSEARTCTSASSNNLLKIKHKALNPQSSRKCGTAIILHVFTSCLTFNRPGFSYYIKQNRCSLMILAGLPPGGS